PGAAARTAWATTARSAWDRTASRSSCNDRPMRKLLLIVVLCAAAPAHAGRSRFGWLYDSETLPARIVEIESWVQEEDGKGGEDETLLWLAPILGLTNQIELAFPVEWTLTETATSSTARFERYGVELRLRLNEPDPVEAGPFGALIRV